MTGDDPDGPPTGGDEPSGTDHADTDPADPNHAGTDHADTDPADPNHAGADGRPADTGHGTATAAVHAGARPDPATGARATPVYQTTNYVFEDAATAADLYALEAEGDVYSRISNPTVRVLEDRLAALEGGTGAVATASGMAAFDAALFVLAEPGANVVAASDAYGGTTAYLANTARRRGIEPRFVDTLEYEAYAEAIDDETAAVHVETLANPSLVTPDFEALAEVCTDRGVPLFVDNTFAPTLCRPLERGADLVWASTTKWIHGGGTTVGGVLVDGGSFPWADHADRYPEVGAPNPAFGGLRFADRFPEAPFAATARHRAVRSLGTLQSPFDAWVTLQGLQTLPLRMDRHCGSALAVARFLGDHPAVEWVTYPGLADHPTHGNATRYLDGYGGVVTFGTGDYDSARRTCERVELVSFLANIGDAKSLVVHPASTTHAQLSAEERAEAGVTPDLLRLSVGIEDPADVMADLDRALSAATA